MKKKIIMRSILGFPIGVAIGYIITIFVSLCWADGYYYPCVPELIAMMGNEINAVLLQTVLCGALGAVCAAGSVIWEIEHWGIIKQTIIYFAIISFTMMPVSYFAYWMEHSLKGFLSYFGIFALIFIAIWVLEFFVGKYNVKHMNARLHKMNGGEQGKR